MKKSLAFILISTALLLSDCAKKKQTVAKDSPPDYSINTDSLKSVLRFLASDSLRGRMTADAGQKNAAKYIWDRLRTYGLKPLFTDRGGHPSFLQQFTLKSHPFKSSYKDLSPYGENVAAYVQGEDTSEWVIVSAHYDHMGIMKGNVMYGADDNGSGTSALLEMARVSAKKAAAGNKPKRNLVFLFVSGEEIGLLGSAHFVKEPPMPLSRIVVDLNVDMIGRCDSIHETNKNYVYVIGSDRLSLQLDSINNAVNKNCCGMELDYKYNDSADKLRLYYRSDHYNFAKNNIPVTFFFSGLHKDYHKTTDTEDKIDYALVQKRANLILQIAWELSYREQRIKLKTHE